MIEFDNCDVIIGTEGVIAESASIQSQNNLQTLNPIGFQRGLQIPAGGVQSSASISYIANLLNEPNILLINQLKEHTTGIFPIRLEIGGVYGSFYLQSYNLRAAPNEFIRINTNYVSYESLSGSISAKRNTIVYEINNTTIPHGWTTFVTSSGNYLNIPTYELNYQLNLAWEPIYVLGQKSPAQYLFHGGTESFNLVRDDHYIIEFSGENATNRLLSSSVNNHIELKALSFKWGEDHGTISFNCADAQINSTSLEASPGEYVHGTINIVRNF